MVEPTRGEELRVLTDRIGDVDGVVLAELWPQRGEIPDVLGVEFRDQPGGLHHREGPAELTGSLLKDRVAVLAGHGQHQVGLRCDPRFELSCDEPGGIAAQFGQGVRGIPGASAGR
jgi:hypothetical protein